MKITNCHKCISVVGMFSSCGTGMTWSLYKCHKCGQLYAQAAPGGYIPDQVKQDRTIICLPKDY